MKYRDNLNYGKYNIITIRVPKNTPGLKHPVLYKGFIRAIDIVTPETTGNCSICFRFKEVSCTEAHA
jgi:hypothetical protein